MSNVKIIPDNIIGKKFNFLSVLEVYKKNGERWCSCLCECGEKTDLRIYDLGVQKRCKKNCSLRAYFGSSLIKKRPVVYFEDYIKIDISTKKYPNSWAIFDKEDFDIVFSSGTSIYIDHDKYVYKTVNKKKASIHRLIMNPPKNMLIDHIDGNPLNNRKINLRIVDDKDNARNQKLFITNKSGYAGVQWKKSRKKWLSTIKIKSKSIHIGYFSCKEEAHLARKKKQIELGFHPNHGEKR